MIDCRRWLFVLTVVCGGLSYAASAADVHIAYSEPLENLSFARGGAEFQKPGPRLEQRMRFDAFSRRFEIELTPNATLIDAVERQALGENLDIFRGSLPGITQSWARIVIADGVPQGLVFDGTEIFAIESGDDGQAKMFRLADLQIEPGKLTCASPGTVNTGTELLELVTSEVNATIQRAQGAQSEIDVALVADFEFASVPLRDAEAEMITRMNNVDGIFSSQLGVQISIGRIDVFGSSNDPFSDQTNSSDLLRELADFRESRPEQRANGLTHLFTGRNLDGSTVGIAYSGNALCSGRFGAGLTQGTNGVTTDSLVAAHELGHNFGAPHDGESGSVCEGTPEDFLMAPRLNGSDTFSNCSIQQMEDDVARASCISALASTDVAVAAPSSPGRMLLGDSATVSFDVTSAGTESADGVSVTATLPASLSLDSASTSVGSCTSGAGTADCTIGSLAAGSGATVNLSVTAAAVGASQIAVTASANVDENATNDQANIVVTVDPAVDLIATARAPGTVAVDQQTTLRPQVENRASIAATNVTVSVSPTDGLRIDTASWSAGSCSVSSGVAECTASSLAANSTTSLDVRVTALAEGSQSYSVSAAAAEADRNGANNDSSVNFSVNEAVAADSGGGGAISVLLALLVFLALLRARQYWLKTTVLSPSGTVRHLD